MDEKNIKMSYQDRIDIDSLKIKNLKSKVNRLRNQLSYTADAINTAEVSLSFMHEAKHALHNINALFHSVVDLIPQSNLQYRGNRQLLDEVTSELDYLTKIFRNIHRVMRARKPFFKKEHLKDLIEDLFLLFRRRMDYFKCRYEFKCEEDIRIVCDRDLLTQTFMNLLLNSIQAVRNKKGLRVIRISALYDSEDSIRISFWDNGIGIQTDDILKIFEPFYSTKIDGTGFGLALCKEIIEYIHKGEIGIESKEGEYTEVSVILPRRLKP